MFAGEFQSMTRRSSTDSSSPSGIGDRHSHAVLQERINLPIGGGEAHGGAGTGEFLNCLVNGGIRGIRVEASQGGT